MTMLSEDERLKAATALRQLADALEKDEPRPSLNGEVTLTRLVYPTAEAIERWAKTQAYAQPEPQTTTFTLSFR